MINAEDGIHGIVQVTQTIIANGNIPQDADPGALIGPGATTIGALLTFTEKMIEETRQ